MISVCMATYNGEKYISEQIASILPQLGAEDELIVSDDGSKDRTVELVASVGDSRIRIVHNPDHHGYTGNFYHALRYARGEHIFLCDQDDVWLPNKVAVMCSALETADFAVSDCSHTDEELNVIVPSHFEAFGIRGGFAETLLHCKYIGCCMAFNRCVLDAMLPAPENTDEVSHDWWAALVGERYFKTAHIREVLMYYRRHTGTVSNGGFAPIVKNRTVIDKLRSRAIFLRELRKIRGRVKAIQKTQGSALSKKQ